MRTFLSAIALTVIIAFPAFSADESPQRLAIPTPPGATVVMEATVEADQIQAQVENLISGTLGSPGDKTSPAANVDMAKLRDALSTLKCVQYVEMKTSAPSSIADTIALFEKQIGGRRIIYDSGSVPGTGIILIATQDGGYFGAMIEPAGGKGKSKTGTTRAARLFGFPDVGKAIQAFVPVLMQQSEAKGQAVPGKK
jgi:hypothetical protein